MPKGIIFSLVTALATPSLANTPEEAAKQLAQYYFKGSELERKVNYVIRKLPVELQLSLTYAAQFNQVYSGGLLVYRKEFP